MNDYNQKKIVIIGCTLTGLSCVNFFLSKGVIPIIMDSRINPPGIENLPSQVKCYLGSISSKLLYKSDLIVVTPGISLSHPSLKAAADAGIEIIGDIELFCREVNTPIIAITGSNGKSTVTALVGEMAKTAGLNVGVGGNIGLPVLRLLKSSIDLYVLELSSFQLETTYTLKATVATVLNIQEDHMDRYPQGIQEYSSIKLRIYNNSKMNLINIDEDITWPKKNKDVCSISFGTDRGDYYLSNYKGSTWLSIRNRVIFDTNKIKIRGQHNYINSLAALALADCVNIPRKFSLKTLMNFPGLPHRFQLIHESNGVRWINDSKSTNVSSTEAALKSIQCKGTLWLLLGGDGKSANFFPLKKYLQTTQVKLFCFGRHRHLLYLLQPKLATCTETLEQAIEQISIVVKKEDVVLLSPACSSLDQFENFEHRGNVFIQMAKKFG